MTRFLRNSAILALLTCPSILASSYGVTISASGGAGDACTGIYAAEEGFSSGALSAAQSLTYSGSAVGFQNSYPYPLPGPEGCQYSPDFAHIAASGTAEIGLLRATASADMETVGLIQAGSDIYVGWTDTITALTSGTFMMTIHLNASTTATPACPGNNSLAKVNFGFQERGPYNQFDIADWAISDCNPSPGPYYTYGSTTVIDNDTVELFEYLGAGQSMTLSGSLEARANAGLNQSAFANAGDTAILNVVGLGGATYSAASGSLYDATDVVPEPASFLLIGTALALVARRKGRFRLS